MEETVKRKANAAETNGIPDLPELRRGDGSRGAMRLQTGRQAGRVKLKKLAACCLSTKQAYLWNQTDTEGCVRQWISNGRAAWALDGLPMLGAHHLPALFSLSPKQVTELTLAGEPAPEELDFRDTVDEESTARICDWEIATIRSYVPVISSGLGYLLDRDWFSPIETEGDLILTLRRTKYAEKPYFAAKAGLLTVALMMPEAEVGFLQDELTRMESILQRGLSLNNPVSARLGEERNG